MVCVPTPHGFPEATTTLTHLVANPTASYSNIHTLSGVEVKSSQILVGDGGWGGGQGNRTGQQFWHTTHKPDLCHLTMSVADSNNLQPQNTTICFACSCSCLFVYLLTCMIDWLLYWVLAPLVTQLQIRCVDYVMHCCLLEHASLSIPSLPYSLLLFSVCVNGE